MHLEAVTASQMTKKRPQVSLLSNRIQNDLVKALAICVRKNILEEIRDATIYSVLIDETTVVRHVHEMEIKERFIQICDVQSTTGQELTNVVVSLLEKKNV